MALRLRSHLRRSFGGQAGQVYGGRASRLLKDNIEEVLEADQQEDTRQRKDQANVMPATADRLLEYRAAYTKAELSEPDLDD